MLRVWVHGCDPGRVSDGSRLALCQTLSIECPSSIFFWPVYFAILVPSSLSFLFVCVYLLLSLELGRCSSDLFLASRPRTGFATTYYPFPRLPTHGHDRPCRRDVGRVFLAGVRPDSPSRRRIPSCYCPGPGRGAAIEMGQRSVRQAHTTPVNSVHVSAPCADMFGDSVCAREADDTAAESWYVPLYERVHPVCRLAPGM